MTTVNANTTNFTQKLASLKSGDTLILADGFYGALKLSHNKYADAITIKGGTFSSVALVDVKGVHLDGSTVRFVPDANSNSNSQAVRIYDSVDVVIDHARISGGNAVNGVKQTATKLDATGNVLGLPVGKGVVVDFSDHVTVTNSDISMFAKGVVFTDAEQLTVSNNQIHDLRTTPISGSVHADVLITGNHSWDSHPWNFGGTGDHGDRIHIWTDDRTATGIVISNNLLEQGKGDPMLGIYLDDNGQGYGFKDAIIAHNTVIDGTGQGLRLENTTGTVFDNTLTWSGTGNAYNNTPRIQIAGNSHDIDFINNRANVSIEKGVHDLNFLNETGTFTKGTGFTAEAAATIHVATGNLTSALAAVGLSPTGTSLGGAAATTAAAKAFAASSALMFAGFDLAGHAAPVVLHPVGHIG